MRSCFRCIYCRRKRRTIYIRRVRFSWKRAGYLKRLLLTSSDLWASYPELSKDLLPYLRFARPLSPGNKVNQPVFRYYPRVYTRRCERKRGTLFADEKRAQKTRTTQSWPQFCGRGRVAENGGGLLSSFLNNTRIHTETPRGVTLAELKVLTPLHDIIKLWIRQRKDVGRRGYFCVKFYN